VQIRPGPTDVLQQLSERRGVNGFYIAGGVLMYELSLAGVATPELFGPGEFVGPSAQPQSVIGATATTSCIEPARVLILGPSFARAVGRWPALLELVERRKAEQLQRAGIFAVISHLSRVEDRTLAALWHLADTWGHVTKEGTVIPFPLTHEMLGRFVRARRPTVTLALSDLGRAGLVARAADGTWLLPPGSAAALQERLGGQGVNPVTMRARVTREQARAAVRQSAKTNKDVKRVREETRAVVAASKQTLRRVHEKPPESA
jgi:hypothetical protein